MLRPRCYFEMTNSNKSAAPLHFVCVFCSACTDFVSWIDTPYPLFLWTMYGHYVFWSVRPSVPPQVKVFVRGSFWCS